MSCRGGLSQGCICGDNIEIKHPATSRDQPTPERAPGQSVPVIPVRALTRLLDSATPDHSPTLNRPGPTGFAGVGSNELSLPRDEKRGGGALWRTLSATDRAMGVARCMHTAHRCSYRHQRGRRNDNNPKTCASRASLRPNCGKHVGSRRPSGP